MHLNVMMLILVWVSSSMPTPMKIIQPYSLKSPNMISAGQLDDFGEMCVLEIFLGFGDLFDPLATGDTSISTGSVALGSKSSLVISIWLKSSSIWLEPSISGNPW